MARRGFTLLEMIVTILLISILGLIATATYKAVSGGTDKASAQHSVRAVALVEQRLFSRESSFAGATALAGIEDAYTYTAGASTTYTQVSVKTDVVDPTGLEGVALAARQGDQCVMAVVVDPSLGAPSTASTQLSSGQSCTASLAESSVGNAEGEWEL